jgi:hypothetical protein
MNNDIQVGDTVEVVSPPNPLFYLHPTIEDRFIQLGDQVVVVRIRDDLIYYLNVKKQEQGIFCWRVKKVMPNQVEIKFR